MTYHCENCGSESIYCKEQLINSAFDIRSSKRIDDFEFNITCSKCGAILDTKKETLIYPSEYTQRDAADAVIGKGRAFFNQFIIENDNEEEETDISDVVSFDCTSFRKCNRCNTLGFVSLEQSIIDNKMHFAVKCHYCNTGTPMCSSTQDALKLWGEMNAH